MMRVMKPIRLSCLWPMMLKLKYAQRPHDLGRPDELPTLPTLPLVLRTLVLPSVLCRFELDRTLPMLRPLPFLSLGVLGRPLMGCGPGAVFSASLPLP
jgi:hypothetical protein